MSKLYRILILIVVLGMALSVAACGGDKEPEAAAPAEVAEAPAAPVGDPVKGKEIFDVTCIACHGAGGIGVTGLGKDMTTSTFIAGLNDADLLTFIKQGRDTSHPDNTTGVAMPPKGGNPALSDEDILNVIAYIRTIHVD